MTAPYQLLPPLTDDEQADLRADIETNGIQVPVLVDEDGNIIDGHHRASIAESLGVPCPRSVVTGHTDAEKRDMALRLNLHRRSLSREQKRELIAASLRADPDLSDRQHAERTGSSPTTTGAVRADLVESGDVSNLDTRTDSAGRQQPAGKPTREPFDAQAVADQLVANDPAIAERTHAPAPSSAVSDYLAGSRKLQDVDYLRRFLSAVEKSHDLLMFDADRVAELMDDVDLESLDRHATSLVAFVDTIRHHRRGLRLIGGTK